FPPCIYIAPNAAINNPKEMINGGKDKFWLLVAIIGLIITFGAMFLRSVIDDHGYHIYKEDLEDKGGKA
ncbi:hypothetical protein ACT4UT_35330, partial [Bacillus sp. B-TM1]